MIENLISQLPTYIIITIFLAYVIWSKFLNEGGYKPKNIDDILDILIIFVAVFVTLFSVTYFVLYTPLILRFDIDFNPSNMFQYSQAHVWLVLLALYFVLVLALLIGKKYCTKKDLQIISIHIQHIFIFLSILIFTVLLSLYLSPLRDVLLLNFFALFYASLLPIAGVWILNLRLFRRLQKIEFNRRLYLPILIVYIVVFVGTFSLYPNTDVQSQTMSYSLINSTHAFEYIEKNFYIKNWGKLGLVSLDYGDLSISENSLKLNYQEITDGRVYNHSKSIDKSGIENLRKEHGIEDYKIDNQSSSIFIKFDARKLEEKRFISFTVHGEKIVNISKDFFIEKPKTVSCPAGNCSIIIIVNNLNHSVGGSNIRLLKEELHPTTCKLINVSGDYYTHKRQSPIKFEVESIPDKNYGRLRISSVGRGGIYVQILSISGRVQLFDVEVFRIEGSSKANLTFTFLCV